MQMRHECLHTLREIFIEWYTAAGARWVMSHAYPNSAAFIQGLQRKTTLIYKENKGPAVRDIIYYGKQNILLSWAS